MLIVSTCIVQGFVVKLYMLLHHWVSSFCSTKQVCLFHSISLGNVDSYNENRPFPWGSISKVWDQQCVCVIFHCSFSSKSQGKGSHSERPLCSEQHLSSPRLLQGDRGTCRHGFASTVQSLWTAAVNAFMQCFFLSCQFIWHNHVHVCAELSNRASGQWRELCWRGCMKPVRARGGKTSTSFSCFSLTS